MWDCGARIAASGGAPRALPSVVLPHLRPCAVPPARQNASSWQLVNDLPFSQPEVGPDGEVEAAAVLAAMRRGQAQLRWVTQEGDSNMSSDLQPPPPSPGVSSA